MSLIYGAIGYEKLSENSDAELLRKELVDYPSDEFDALHDDNCSVGLFSIRLRKEPFPRDRIVQNENVIVIADARLDYRDELVDKMKIEGISVEKTSDPILILKAFEKWGEKCIDHLEGDFVFLIYHKKSKEIWGARDPIGFRPLFFVQQKTQLLFSTSLKGLLSIPSVSTKMNEDFWLNRMLSLDCCPSASPHEAIHQIPIGHEITFMQEGFDIKRFFWWKRKVSKVKGKNYETELKKILEQAVETRLYPDYEVGAQLSGGLDSSAVVAIASKQLAKKNNEQKLWTVSSVANEQKGHPRDERPWILSFTPHFKNVESAFFTPDLNSTLSAADYGLLAFMRFRRCPSFLIERDFQKHLESQNCKTILTGWRGDHYITRHANYSWNEILLNGEFGFLIKNLNKASKWRGISSFKLVKRLLKKNRPFKGPFADSMELFNESWVDKNKVKIEEQLAKGKKWARMDMEWDFNQTLPQGGKELLYYMEDVSIINKKPTYTLHPLSDRRVISYALNLPAQEYEKDGMDRSLFRRAMKDALPERIRMRVDKGLFDYKEKEQLKIIMNNLFQKNSNLLEQSALSQYINLRAVFSIIEDYLERKESFVTFKVAQSLNIIGYLLYFVHVNKYKETTNGKRN